MSRASIARLLHAAPPADLATLIGDFRALLAYGATEGDTAAAAAQIGQTLRALSQAELEILEQAAQGMPAEAGVRVPAFEDEDADPVGPAR